jgi:hypothetical protein
MRSVATELEAWDRPPAESAIKGLAELRARHRERHKPQISERERRDSDPAAAESVVGALHKKWNELGAARLGAFARSTTMQSSTAGVLLRTSGKNLLPSRRDTMGERLVLKSRRTRLGTRDYEAPVGSIEQAAMLDRFIADVSGAMTEALAIWVDGPPVMRVEHSHGLDASDREQFAHCRCAASVCAFLQVCRDLGHKNIMLLVLERRQNQGI